MRDLYEVLAVARNADDEAIKKAYRAKARSLHPDTGGDEEGFKELTTAYEVLRNPQTRANYDRYGDPRGLGGADVNGFGDLNDLINSFFGGGFGGGGARARAPSGAGRDAVVDVVLDLAEAATGVNREVQTTVMRSCTTCGGTGAADGSSPVRCETCAGQGQVQQVARSVFGQVLTTTTCPACRGSGQRIVSRCPDCSGEGRRQLSETIGVDIPAGVDEGTRLRLTGRGEAGRNGARAGDLYVRVRVRPHDVFTRDGNDLHCELRLSMPVAALGSTLTLPTLDGPQSLAVPPGTQSGDVLTLRRAGMPKLSGGGARGNLYVRCRVETPTRLTPEQEELLRGFAELRGDQIGEHLQSKGLLGRLRDAFGGPQAAQR